MSDMTELKYTGARASKFGIKLPDFKASFDPSAQKTVKVPTAYAHMLLSEGVWEIAGTKRNPDYRKARGVLAGIDDRPAEEQIRELRDRPTEDTTDGNITDD